MRALGHQCFWETSNTNFYAGGENVINVMVEGFVPQHLPFIMAAREKGARFLMLATEEPTEKGFNHGTQAEMVRRQRDFPEVAKLFEGIFHLVPGEHVTKWYSQFAPTAYVELGYAPSLVRNFGIEPEYEFGFYGSLTPRRMRILKKLANRVNKLKAVKVVADFKTQEERDQQMSRAKVIIQIRKFEAMGLVSSSRCNTSLCIGRPVVAEPHLLSKPWDEVVKFTNSLESFYAMAPTVAAMWKNIYRDQMDKFKTKFTPEICVGEPLRKIGILEKTAAAA